MKKYLIIGFLAILILSAAAIFVLNYMEVISVSSWGERAVETVINAPYIRDRAALDDNYQELQAEYELLQAEIEQLEDENYLLSVDLQETEEQLTRREDEIESLQQQLAEIQDQDLVREERVDRLRAIYSEMDPYDAAPIFDNMDRELALLILTDISVRRAAAILQELDPYLAAELSFFLERLGEEDYEDIAAEYEARLQEGFEDIEEINVPEVPAELSED